MSYETTFRLHGELDKQFVPWTKEKPAHKNIERSKNILLAICMQAPDDSKDSFQLYKHYDKIAWAIAMYVGELKEDWKHWLKESLDREDEYEKKGEVTFLGRCSDTWTEENLEEYFTSSLFRLSIYDTGSPFDDNRDKFVRKEEELSEIINDIEECVTDMMDTEFINRYRDSEDADEEDGYTHHFPEYKEEDDFDVNDESNNVAGDEVPSELIEKLDKLSLDSQKGIEVKIEDL